MGHKEREGESEWLTYLKSIVGIIVNVPNNQ